MALLNTDELAAYCLKCGLREEIKTKMSWKHFTIVMGTIGTIVGTILYLIVPAGVHGIERIVDTNKATLEAIHDVERQVIKLDVKQQSILNRLKYRGDRSETTDPRERTGYNDDG